MTIARGVHARRRGLHRDVVDDLGKRIVGGEWPAGDSLPSEDELAIQLSVSRTVVREAVKVLASKGLIESRPKTGTRVLDRSRWSLADSDVLRWQLAGLADPTLCRELLEIRAIIEPRAADLAAARRTEDEARHLASLLDLMEESLWDPPSYILADVRFHRAILRATHNLLLSQLTDTIQTALVAVRRVTVRVTDGPARAMPAHRAVADAVIRRDGDGAARAMAALIQDTSRDFEAVLADGVESG